MDSEDVVGEPMGRVKGRKRKILKLMIWSGLMRCAKDFLKIFFLSHIDAHIMTELCCHVTTASLGSSHVAATLVITCCMSSKKELVVFPESMLLQLV